MSRSNIPVKTSEGVQEIKARLLGLAPRIRTALLLVDGVKSVAELERLMLAAGVTPGALQLLMEKGLIRFQEEPKPAIEAKAAEAPAATDAGTAPQSQDAAPAPLSSPRIEETPPTEIPAVPAAQPQVRQEVAKPQGIEQPKIVVAQEPLVSIPMIPLPTARSKPAPPAPEAEPEDMPDMFPEFAVAPPPEPEEPEQQLEVATLIELESILGEVTKADLDTILGVATQLELTPTQALAPRTAVLATAGPSRLPPLAQAEYDFKMASAAQKPVIPASVLRMNLTVARAHLASALDLHLEIDGYALKQGIMACESREELEQLFRLIEGALMRKLDRPAVLRIMGVAQALLER